jgi:signal transduction histidine kinase
VYQWFAIPVLFAAYAVGVSFSWRVVLCVIPGAVVLFVLPMSFFTQWWAGMGPMVPAAMVAGGAIGQVVRSRRELAAARIARARQDERLRIAQDVHDMVAHHIAVVNVQAGVATHLVKDQPDKAATALGHVTTASAKALDELGELLGVLREPTAGLGDLDKLVDENVELTVAGPRRPLPATVDAVAFRVIQESLTNARKHGTGKARLRVSYEPGRLVIETRNLHRRGAQPGSGYGLVGMRERVTLLGGDLTAGPQGDEFVVRATMEAR